MKAIQKKLTAVNLIQLVNALALAGALLFLPARSFMTPPPFQFTADVYLPVKSALCPGEALEWEPHLVVNRAPTVVAASRTIWDVEAHRTVVPARSLSFFVWTERELGRPLDHPARFPVPELPPGQYELRAGASAFNSEAAAYRVPFTVPGGCAK